ncbi:MAG: GrpB family protein [Clostridiales bacterium]|nr:GrpB family protein [Clostridiales bacterium]
MKYYKPVDQITDEERAALFPIVLQEHNPAWKDWYAKEKNILTRLVGVGNIARISHYGSTAVPGLLAKPTIDILLEITDGANVDTLISNLENAGYVCIKQPKVPCSPSPSLMFLKGYTPLGFAEKVYHIHVRYYGDWDELYFRDYLITHSDIAAEYAALKQKLQKEYEYDRDGYTEAKGEFIKATTEKAKKETEIA